MGFTKGENKKAKVRRDSGSFRIQYGSGKLGGNEGDVELGKRKIQAQGRFLHSIQGRNLVENLTSIIGQNEVSLLSLKSRCL